MNFEVVVLILKFFILFQSKSLTVTSALSRAKRITQKIAMMEIRQPFFFDKKFFLTVIWPGEGKIFTFGSLENFWEVKVRGLEGDFVNELFDFEFFDGVKSPFFDVAPKGVVLLQLGVRDDELV
jgi:hypothetical protein